MAGRVCEGCGAPLNLYNAQARTCSTRCRVRVHRAAKRIEQSWRAAKATRRWVRARGKMPLRVNGRAASSTDPRTWSTFDDVQAGPGDGLGVMLGAGLGCYDLDRVTDDEARTFLAGVTEPVLYCERSLSGNGVHVFVEAPEAPGWRRIVNGMNVERYTRERFIRMTGNRFD